MISVVIPAHGAAIEPWFTVSCCLMDLESHDPEDYEIIVVFNGEAPPKGWVLHNHPCVKYAFAGATVDSPQAARAMGFEMSSGETVFFLDSHVLMPSGFFDGVLRDMYDSGADFMGVAARFDRGLVFASHFDVDGYLWTKKTLLEPPNSGPFKVATHPHGAFAVRRDSFLKAGGYWRELHGFGGEETQLCLKFWLMGMTCWATPRVYHWHWLPAGGRRGSETFRDYNFVRNFLLIAAAYGNDGEFERSYESLRVEHWGASRLFPELYDFLKNSPEVAKEKFVIETEAKYRSIGELRELWAREEVTV